MGQTHDLAVQAPVHAHLHAPATTSLTATLDPTLRGEKKMRLLSPLLSPSGRRALGCLLKVSLSIHAPGIWITLGQDIPTTPLLPPQVTPETGAATLMLLLGVLESTPPAEKTLP